MYIIVTDMEEQSLGWAGPTQPQYLPTHTIQHHLSAIAMAVTHKLL
jgi:hypothetical protein